MVEGLPPPLKQPSAGSQSGECGHAKASNLVIAKLIGLATVGNLDELRRYLGTESSGNCGSCYESRLVAVEHDDDSLEVLFKKALLVLGERAPHERNNTGQARLMDRQAIEEALDNNHRRTMTRRPVKIEENQRFAKPR